MNERLNPYIGGGLTVGNSVDIYNGNYSKGTGQDNEFNGDIKLGQLNVGERVSIHTNAEGGNIYISSPSGNSYIEMDIYNGKFRLFRTPYNAKEDTGFIVNEDDLKYLHWMEKP